MLRAVKVCKIDVVSFTMECIRVCNTCELLSIFFYRITAYRDKTLPPTAIHRLRVTAGSGNQVAL